MRLTLKKYLLIIFLALLIEKTSSLKHHLVLTDDPRVYTTVSSFGYLRGGRLDVIVQNLSISPDPTDWQSSKFSAQFGFVLIKSADHITNPYLMDPDIEDRRLSCMNNRLGNKHYDFVTMNFNPEVNQVLVKCMGDNMLPSITPLPNNSRRNLNDSHGSYLHTYNKRAVVSSRLPSPPVTENSQQVANNRLIKSDNDNKDIVKPVVVVDDSVLAIPEKNFRESDDNNCPGTIKNIPLMVTADEFGRRTYAFNFTMFVRHQTEEGYYHLMFHNCKGLTSMNSNFRFDTPTRFNLSMLIYETNFPEIYLSAGDIPLPQMYFVLSVMFLLIGCIWVNFITRQKESTLRIHHLMTLLVFAKSCSLLFHGINYHNIAIYGQPVVTWAYLYYATRTIKGALFFITIVLIGSGWSFIKHILSDKDKKIILVVLGLQVIAHIAEIVLDESTEGQVSYEVSSQICDLVDLICCLAILYPISLSVRHLEEASRTDGKAAINLRKLELFKRFYIISTIYIYITRIVTLIFRSTLSYRYSWLAELVFEFSTLIYFITTGYYFQPMPTNPYLLLSSDNDLEEDILFSVDGATPFNDLSGRDQDRNALLDSGEQKVTRRIIDDDVV